MQSKSSAARLAIHMAVLAASLDELVERLLGLILVLRNSTMRNTEKNASKPMGATQRGEDRFRLQAFETQGEII